MCKTVRGDDLSQYSSNEGRLALRAGTGTSVTNATWPSEQGLRFLNIPQPGC